MSELSSYERQRLAEIEVQLTEERSLAQQARRFERGGARFRAGAVGFWLSLVLGVLAPIGTVLATATTTPWIGLGVALTTGTAFAVTMLCTASRR